MSTRNSAVEPERTRYGAATPPSPGLMGNATRASHPQWRFDATVRRSGAALLCALVTLVAFAPRARAAEAQDETTRLRQAVRNVTLQLRAAENDKAALQATQATLADEKKALNAKFEALKKDVVAERAQNDKAIAELKRKLAAQEAEVARLKAEGEKWQASSSEASALATTKETERVKLVARITSLERQNDDLRRQNLQLFRTANEILTRYEKFGLGEALLAREPFVGETRTKLENLVQGYADTLAANRAQ